MAFVKRLWADRDAEHLNRRVLTPAGGGNSVTYHVDRDEGIVFAEGDELNAQNLNDLESRISEGIESKQTFVFMGESEFARAANPTWNEIPEEKRIDGAILAIMRGR